MFSDPPLRKCPKCGKKVEKQPSAPAIQFKGTGWYITDYARKSPGGAGADSGSEKQTEGKPDPGDAKSPESKPDPGAKKAAPAKKDSGSKGKAG